MYSMYIIVRMQKIGGLGPRHSDLEFSAKTGSLRQDTAWARAVDQVDWMCCSFLFFFSQRHCFSFPI